MADRSTYDVFVSHYGADKAAATALVFRLAGEAELKPFLDTWHLALSFRL
jgi:hypothetical protein